MGGVGFWRVTVRAWIEMPRSYVFNILLLYFVQVPRCSTVDLSIIKWLPFCYTPHRHSRSGRGWPSGPQSNVQRHAEQRVPTCGRDTAQPPWCRKAIMGYIAECSPEFSMGTSHWDTDDWTFCHKQGNPTQVMILSKLEQSKARSCTSAEGSSLLFLKGEMASSRLDDNTIWMKAGHPYCSIIFSLYVFKICIAGRHSTNHPR